MKITADVKKIQALKDFFFVVPDYQREYVWEKDKHVARFLQDINEEFDPGKSMQEQSSYFIGSTIIVERKNGFYDVIDGQQRLTTIIITLCAMRNILEKEQFDVSRNSVKNNYLRIIKDILSEYSIERDRNTPRLTLQYEESKDYLDKLIENKEFNSERTRSINRMAGALETIENFLQGLRTENEQHLISFVGYFLSYVEMVVIQPDDISSALKIFETINERGVGLNPMDLLKNLLFSKADEDDFQRIKNVWKQIINNLSNCGEGENPLRFLRYFLIARYHNGVLREDEIYKWIISGEGKEKLKYEKQPVELAGEILRASVKYSAFIKATSSEEYDSDYPSITGIGYLGKRNVRQHLILLLALKDNFDKGSINLLAKNIEPLFFYYAINKVLTKYYESTFALWAVKIRTLQTIDDLKSFISTEIGEVIQSLKGSFAYKFDQISFSDLTPQYRLRYIFGEIEQYIRKQSNLPVSNLLYYHKLDIEHILPSAGVNIPVEDFATQSDYYHTISKLGNLTLLESSINQSINNCRDLSTDEWFNNKKEAYRNSDIFLTKSLTGITIGSNTAYNHFSKENLMSPDIWSRESIIERQQMLKKIILQRWGVNI